MILKVHRSNFFMGGFVESPATEELAAVARAGRIPLIEDLGSGAVAATETLAGLEHEPTPAEVLKRGVDLVCFSGDKLLGGPQAGLIAGRARLVSALKREPFFRALRCDKLILSALQTTVDLYLHGRAAECVPALAMLRMSVADLAVRAAAMVARLKDLPLRAQVGEGQAQVGGGTLPRSAIPSVTLDVVPQGMALAEFSERLRRCELPVIGYISGGRFKVDLRTVFPEQDDAVVGAVRKVAGAVSS